MSNTYHLYRRHIEEPIQHTPFLLSGPQSPSILPPGSQFPSLPRHSPSQALISSSLPQMLSLPQGPSAHHPHPSPPEFPFLCPDPPSPFPSLPRTGQGSGIAHRAAAAAAIIAPYLGDRRLWRAPGKEVGTACGVVAAVAAFPARALPSTPGASAPSVWASKRQNQGHSAPRVKVQRMCIFLCILRCASTRPKIKVSVVLLLDGDMSSLSLGDPFLLN